MAIKIHLNKKSFLAGAKVTVIDLFRINNAVNVAVRKEKRIIMPF